MICCLISVCKEKKQFKIWTNCTFRETNVECLHKRSWKYFKNYDMNILKVWRKHVIVNLLEITSHINNQILDPPIYLIIVYAVSVNRSFVHLMWCNSYITYFINTDQLYLSLICTFVHGLLVYDQSFINFSLLLYTIRTYVTNELSDF